MTIQNNLSGKTALVTGAAAGKAEKVAADLRTADGSHRLAAGVRAPYYLVQQYVARRRQLQALSHRYSCTRPCMEA
jgi:NAD(P)-dependent dehydrogenase (short-subunit alcohol dehydrogenase family)